MDSAHLEIGVGFFRGGARPPSQVVRYITTHRQEFGVEPICRVLQFAPSTYYAAITRPLSERAVRDAELEPEIVRVHEENFDVYGVDKVWTQLQREGVDVGRDRVGRLMSNLGLRGVRRGKFKRTTITDGDAGSRPADLVERRFTAAAPNRLWLADITYVSTWEGFLYLAHVQDLFSRRIVGWSMADHLRSELVLDALEMALARRRPDRGLIHHSDQGCQPGLNRSSQQCVVGV